MDAQMRLPAVERTIDEINAAKDVYVRVIGRVIESRDGTMVVDDGTGSVSVMASGVPDAKEGTIVRILGRVYPTGQGFEIRAEFVQDINNLDMNSYKKLRELEKKFGW